MPELREVFEMTTKQIEPDLDSWREQEDRQRRRIRNKKIGTFVVVVAIALAAAAAIILNLDTGGRTPANDSQQPSLNPTAGADPGAIAAAEGFADAFAAFDSDKAISYLADDADLSSLDAHTIEGLPMELELLRAMGYRQRLLSCGTSSTRLSGTVVGCTVDWHGIRSAEIGRGPYPGSFDFTVRDGEIVRVSVDWNTDKFSPQMWEPFAAWVLKEYPRDAAAMYNADQTNFLLTKRSVRLWEQRTQEYVDVVTARTEGQ
jgi:hypothetical protein